MLGMTHGISKYAGAATRESGNKAGKTGRRKIDQMGKKADRIRELTEKLTKLQKKLDMHHKTCATVVKDDGSRVCAFCDHAMDETNASNIQH